MQVICLSIFTYLREIGKYIHSVPTNSHVISVGEPAYVPSGPPGCMGTRYRHFSKKYFFFLIKNYTFYSNIVSIRVSRVIMESNS